MSDWDATMARVNRHRREMNMFDIGPSQDDIRSEVERIVRAAAAARYGIPVADVTAAHMDAHMAAEQAEMAEFARELGWV